jgi:UDP-N-acetylmuramoylalanine--D-glutamate ligase
MMMPLDTRKSYAVIGLGATGLSCVRYLLRSGVVPTVFDTRSAPPGAAELSPNVELCCGQLDGNRLAQFDVLVLSPGLDQRLPAIRQAVSAGGDLVGDIELFARVNSVPVIAITGSNGKTTVTTLVGEMARAAGIKVAVGGNIGVPVLDLLDSDTELLVLELSSFQLETTHSLRPVAATVLNVSEDHLDRYDSYEDYRQAKLAVYRNAKTCVVNADDALTMTDGMSDYMTFSTEGGADYDIQGASSSLCCRNELVMACSELALVGRHNWANGLAALALADAAGISREGSQAALREFGGLPHRCELVAEKNGVRWVNDSKATNIGATMAALAGLSDLQGRVWLIAGGVGKGANFALLAPWLERTAGVVAFGRDADKIKAAYPQTELVQDMNAAVAQLAQRAAAGDLVLLSPACASLDMYRNYMARGDHFRALAEAL